MRKQNGRRPDTLHARAEAMVRARAIRTTVPRIEILAILLASGHPMSHHEVEDRVGNDTRMDRTTIYRVLEWLTENQLAHRVTGHDGVWRYSASGTETHAHPHFQCNRCGRLTCLGEGSYSLALPPGYRMEGGGLTVSGMCADCAA